jgi:hypothetical protein
MMVLPGVNATGRATADPSTSGSIERFLARDDGGHSYRASRRLEARNGDRRGWMEAVTEFVPPATFRYQITSEGGSGYIRSKVLKAMLDGEREAITEGQTERTEFSAANYIFQVTGIDADGLARVDVKPRREDQVLVIGTMFLRPSGGELVRLEGRLAKNPSYWVKNVQVVRTYERIHGVVVPVALDSNAQLRMFGGATLHVDYTYLEIDGQSVTALQASARP